MELRRLPAYPDDRGCVTEIFRNECPTGVVPLQWTMTRTQAGVVRGVHVHIRHDDYFVLVQGATWVGLHDLRAGSPSARRAALFELRGERPTSLFIPHGVAHGFLFTEASIYALATSHYYDPADELGCHWRDPGLGLAWPVSSARLSARDAALPSLREVAQQIPAWRAE